MLCLIATRGLIIIHSSRGEGSLLNLARFAEVEREG